VIDVPAGFQRSVQLYNQGLQYIRQGEQIAHEISFIENQATQIAHEIQNLQTLPKGLNMLDTVKALNARTMSILARANAVSYSLSSAERDFERLYKGVQTLGTDMGAKERELLTARTQAAQIGVLVTSIQDNLTDSVSRLSALLTSSNDVRGNKDAQQLAHQQQGLAIQNQQALSTMIAANARLQAQMAAESAVMRQFQLDYVDQNTAPLIDRGAYQADGALPTYKWTD